MHPFCFPVCIVIAVVIICSVGHALADPSANGHSSVKQITQIGSSIVPDDVVMYGGYVSLGSNSNNNMLHFVLVAVVGDSPLMFWLNSGSPFGGSGSGKGVGRFNACISVYKSKLTHSLGGYCQLHLDSRYVPHWLDSFSSLVRCCLMLRKMICGSMSSAGTRQE